MAGGQQKRALFGLIRHDWREETLRRRVVQACPLVLATGQRGERDPFCRAWLRAREEQPGLAGRIAGVLGGARAGGGRWGCGWGLWGRRRCWRRCGGGRRGRGLGWWWLGRGCLGVARLA